MGIKCCPKQQANKATQKLKKRATKLNRTDQLKHLPILPDQKDSNFNPPFWNTRMAVTPYLVTPIKTYYTESNPYKDRYTKAMSPYRIEVFNHASAITHHYLGNQISVSTRR